MYVPTGKVDKRTSEKMEQYYLFVCVDCVGEPMLQELMAAC